MDIAKKSIEIFCCYAHNDKDRLLFEKLRDHLSFLVKEKSITLWSDDDIHPGVEWEKEIRHHLGMSQIILLLVSSSFIGSDYCSAEMQQALERHDTGEARVIPIILSPVQWSKTPFGKLQALPVEAKPITMWDNEDSAFLDVVQGIEKVIEIIENGQKNEKRDNLPFLDKFPDREEDVLQVAKDLMSFAQRDIIAEAALMDSAVQVLEGLRSSAQLISIEGMGGVGKTTLALYVAHLCLRAPNALGMRRFDYVVWVSAKDNLRQKLWLNEIINTIAGVFGHPMSAVQIEQKKDEIKQLLCGHRTLVVVDNFETIEDPDLEAWIESIQMLGKFLVTSRSKLSLEAYTIELKGLNKASALKLICEYLDLQPNGHSGEVLDPLIAVTQGNPLAIKRTFGYVRALGLKRVLKDLPDPGGNIESVFKRLFTWSWNVMSKEARDLLMVTTFFADKMGKEALKKASGLTSDVLLDAKIVELVGLTLLDTTESIASTPRYSIHPLTRDFAMDCLSNSRQFEEEARERWVGYYLEIYEKHLLPRKIEEPLKEPYWRTLQARNFAALDQEWPNMRKVLIWAVEQEQEELLIKLMLLLTHYMDTSFLYDERLNYGRTAANAADRLGYKREAALFYIDTLTWILIDECRFKDAEQTLDEGLKIAQNNREAVDLVGFAEAFRARIYLEWAEAEECQEKVEKAWEIMEDVLSGKYEPVETYNPIIQVRVYMIAGDIKEKKKDYKEALDWYEKAHRASQEYAKGGSDWELYHRIGFALLERGADDEAEKRFDFILTHYRGVTIETIRARYGKARIFQKKGNIPMAHQFARQALEDLSNMVLSNKRPQWHSDILKFLDGLGPERVK